MKHNVFGVPSTRLAFAFETCFSQIHICRSTYIVKTQRSIILYLLVLPGEPYNKHLLQVNVRQLHLKYFLLSKLLKLPRMHEFDYHNYYSNRQREKSNFPGRMPSGEDAQIKRCLPFDHHLRTSKVTDVAANNDIGRHVLSLLIDSVHDLPLFSSINHYRTASGTCLSGKGTWSMSI